MAEEKIAERPAPIPFNELVTLCPVAEQCVMGSTGACRIADVVADTSSKVRCTKQESLLNEAKEQKEQKDVEDGES